MTNVSKNKEREKKPIKASLSFHWTEWVSGSWPLFLSNQKSLSRGSESNMWHICATVLRPVDCHVLCCRQLDFTPNWIQDTDSLMRCKSNVIFNIMACHGELTHKQVFFVLSHRWNTAQITYKQIKVCEEMQRQKKWRYWCSILYLPFFFLINELKFESWHCW